LKANVITVSKCHQKSQQTNLILINMTLLSATARLNE